MAISSQDTRVSADVNQDNSTMGTFTVRGAEYARTEGDYTESFRFINVDGTLGSTDTECRDVVNRLLQSCHEQNQRLERQDQLINTLLSAVDQDRDHRSLMLSQWNAHAKASAEYK